MAIAARLKDELSVYVERIASESGQMAAIRWFIAGLVIQWSFIVCGQLLVVNGSRLVGFSADNADLIGGYFFFLNITIARILLFAIPIPMIAARKGYPARWAWAIGAFFFGALALSRVAYLSSKQPLAPLT